MPDKRTRPTLRQRVARWLAPPPSRVGQRMYAGARVTNTTLGFGSGGTTTADAELATSLVSLRNRSRQLIRDSAYAKRARMVVVNNVIGAGVGMQAQVMTTRGALNHPVNDRIEGAWQEWGDAQRCHAGGTLHFHDLERLAMGEVFEAGEVLLRKHYRAFGDSRVPLGLEVIESERLANELVDPGSLVQLAGDLRLGVEVDAYQRPVAYWIRRGHPGDIRNRIADAERYERVPAADIVHLRIVDRWPQTRGVPWMHAVLRKLDALSEYSQYEVDAARASASYFATIRSTDEGAPPDPSTAADADDVWNIDPLTVRRLADGEVLDFHTPNRPNAALDPFMRAMLREICAGCGPSYASVSRDYSQSTYSSERVAQLDDRDLWRVLQQWWLRSFRMPLHRVWLRQAVLADAVQGLSPAAYAADMPRYEAVLFKPRGWQWVDPTKEVAAYKEAVKAGFTTTTDVIAQTAGGLDVEDMVATRKRELEMFAEAGIDLDTTVSTMPAAAPMSPQEQPAADPAGDEDSARGSARPVASLINLKRTSA